MAKMRYRYKGPVLAFGKVISNRWEGETIAVSRKQALNNLSYQFKKDANLAHDRSRVTLMDKYLTESYYVM